MNNPRILLLADINSVHTQKWALGLSQQKIKIGIFSLNHSDSNWYQSSNFITCLWQPKKKSSQSLFSKITYLFTLPIILIQIIKFKPNIIHSHYASSYGFLGALTFFKPFIVSVWGSDVLSFPKTGRLQKLIIQFVFWRAKQICVTSNILKKEVQLYTNKTSKVIPFGIDLNQFYSTAIHQHPHDFTFACIKHFEPIYNLDKVVLAFNLLKIKHPLLNFKLKLIGYGSEKQKIIHLVDELHLNDCIEIINQVEHDQVPFYLNQIDVF